MKKFISSLLTAAMICTFSTVAFAGAINKDNVANYKNVVNKATITQGTTSFEVTIGLEDITGADIEIPANAGSYSYLAFMLSPEAMAAGIEATAIEPLVGTTGVGEYIGDGMIIANLEFLESNVVLNKNVPMAKIKFTAPSNIAVGDYSMTVLAEGNMTTDGVTMETITNDWNSTYNFVTVTAPGPVGPTADAVGSATTGGIQEYAVSTGEKVMLSPKYTNQTITEATRFVVTYKGETREFGSDIYEKLGGTTAGGSIQVGSLTFGLIVSDSGAVATDFTFSIQ